MSIALWRIARETARYPADDVSGAVVSETESRWASPGASVVYCSTNIALAVVEALCHMRKSTVPYNRFLVRLDIPEGVWDMREMLDAPAGWDALPPGVTSIHTGDGWRRSKRSPLLVVPSVVVPEESNVLVNPHHPHARKISATTIRKWLVDPRLL